MPSVSPWFWHMGGCHRENPPGMRTPWYDEVWALQGGDGRRAGEQTQRERPFGGEQNPWNVPLEDSRRTPGMSFGGEQKNPWNVPLEESRRSLECPLEESRSALWLCWFSCLPAAPLTGLITLGLWATSSQAQLKLWKACFSGSWLELQCR